MVTGVIPIRWTSNVPEVEEGRLEILKKAVNLEVELNSSEQKENEDVVLYARSYITIATKRVHIEKKDGKLEYESYPTFLLEEKAEEVFEKGCQWYAEARRFFGVDTTDGLEKVIEENKEKRIKKRKELEFK